MGQFSEPVKGAIAIIAAAMIWGLQPIFYDALRHVPASDIAAHRILWSFVFFALVLVLKGRVGALIQAVTNRDQMGWTLLAALMVSFNWFFFVYAIQTGRLTESSLGYYIYPLFSVAFGFLLFRERFPRLQWIAVGLAAFGVFVLTLGLGVVPVISLILAVTFSLYGVIKKRLETGPTVSVTAEVLLLTPFVLIWLATMSDLSGITAGTWGMLMLSGPLTGLPLILFAYASQRVRMSTVGLISYLNPTLQFLVASLIFLEPVTLWHGVALICIWTALALYSGVSIRQERERLASNAATSGTI